MADTRTVHEIKNYDNQLGVESVRYMSDYFINFCLMVFLLGCSEVQLPAELQPHRLHVDQYRSVITL